MYSDLVNTVERVVNDGEKIEKAYPIDATAVLLFGPTGIGKSTLANAIIRGKEVLVEEDED